MNAVVDGLMTNYQKRGKGKKTIVLLHGWGANIDSFDKLSEYFVDKYTLLALDLPGFGGTQTPEQAWNLEHYAEFVASWLKKLKLSEPYALIGHSFGGSVAITGLARKNFTSQNLVLLASAGIRNKNPLKKHGLKLIAKTGKKSLYLLPVANRRKIRNKFYKTIGSDITLLPQ